MVNYSIRDFVFPWVSMSNHFSDVCGTHLSLVMLVLNLTPCVSKSFYFHLMPRL